MERRGDRARSARAGRGAGEAGRLGPVPLRRAPRHRRPALRPADHRRPRGRRRGAGGRARVSPGSRPAITSCSGSSRRAGGARAAPPGTRTCATSALRSASAARSRRHVPPSRANGEDLGLMCMLGTFATTPWSTRRAASRSTKGRPLDRACLLGCGVVTGWGSSVYAAEVGPGDVVAVVGIGGIGANAHAGRPPRRGQADLGDRSRSSPSASGPSSSAPPTPRRRWRRPTRRSPRRRGDAWPTR